MLNSKKDEKLVIVFQAAEVILTLFSSKNNFCNIKQLCNKSGKLEMVSLLRYCFVFFTTI